MGVANLTKTTLKSRKLLSVKEENYSYRSTGVNRSGFVIENILDTALSKGATCVCTKVKQIAKTKTTKSFIQTHNELFDSHESSVLLMIANIFLKKKT